MKWNGVVSILEILKVFIIVKYDLLLEKYRFISDLNHSWKHIKTYTYRFNRPVSH